MIAKLGKLFNDLTTENGKFSHTKWWSNIAYTTATFIMIKLTYMNQLNENYFLVYLGVVASHSSVSKWLGITNNKKKGMEIGPSESREKD